MNFSAPRLDPLPAFISTVVLMLGYLVGMLALLHSIGAQMSGFAGHFHVLLVWAPPVISAVFYSWVSRSASVSLTRRLAQVATATVLAPIVAGSLIGIAGFALLGWSM